MHFSVVVPFARPLDDVYGLLSDVERRPDWQAGLRSVELVGDPASAVGQRWYDVLAIGPRPLMEVTELEPGRLWAEVGEWLGFVAGLRLEFAPTGARETVVRANVTIAAPTWRHPFGWGMAAVGPDVVRHDLRTAAALLH